MNADELARLAHLATRVFRDAVSDSSPLPEWSDEGIDYDARERRIAARIRAYLAGREAPRPATTVVVPRKRGAPRRWVVPSVNDQIVLHACTHAIAANLKRRGRADRDRVYSYRLNDVVSRIAFTRSQIAQWRDFEEATKTLAHERQLLQVDLERAFPSIDPPRFLDFFRAEAGDGAEIELLAVLLRAFGEPGMGIPFINESLFYLGNEYLTVVDRVVQRTTGEFVRFVDDYRIVADSTAALERMYESISANLRSLGFRFNPAKTRLGGEEYLGALTRIAETRQEPDPDAPYGAVLLVTDPRPAVVAALTARLVRRPDEITDGMGRYVMQAARRIRGNAEYRDTLDATLPAEELVGALASQREEWRSIWLLHAAEGYSDRRFLKDVDLDAPLARLWARRVRGDVPAAVSKEALDDMSYLEAGQALYGGSA